MNINEEALKLHKIHKGKLSVESKVPVKNRQDLSLAYTPGVAEPCRQIHKNPETVYDYTTKGNMVAVVTDGTAVLGLGDIGPEAALPVMEGKAVLFKTFANIDAIPICLKTKDVEEIVMIVKNLSPSLGGINLEDISAPRCFEIEERLKKGLDIPVFHDDQHGTAVVVLAGLLNALKLVGKTLDEVKVVTSGAGAAGMAIVKLLISMGLKNVIMCDKMGAIYEGRPEGMNWAKEEIAKVTNREKVTGSLADALEGADVFIGVSGPGLVTQEMIKSMAKDPIIFAMANPIPEIMPDLAKQAGAKVVCTGRSDFPNQVNNVLAFPGIFRGALDVRATDINETMKIAAAQAIASIISPEEIREDYVIPDPFDKRVVERISQAVAKAAIESGVARVK